MGPATAIFPCDLGGHRRSAAPCQAHVGDDATYRSKMSSIDSQHDHYFGNRKLDTSSSIRSRSRREALPDLSLFVRPRPACSSQCVAAQRAGAAGALARSGWPVVCQWRAGAGRGCSGGPGGHLAATEEAALGEDVPDVACCGAFGDARYVSDLAAGEAASVLAGSSLISFRQEEHPPLYRPSTQGCGGWP